MVMIAGTIATLLLPIQILPKVDEPTLSVRIVLDKETDLDEVEREVTLPLENVVLYSDIVKRTTATTTTKNVNIHLVMKDSASESQINKLQDTINQQINSVSLKISSSEVKQFSTEDDTFMSIAVVPEDIENETIRNEIRDVLIPNLRQIPELRKIEHNLGTYDEYYVFEMKPGKVQSLQKSAQVIQEIQENFTAPLLGTISYNQSQYRVKSESVVTSPEDIMNFRLSTGELLIDLVDMRMEKKATKVITRLNGKDYYSVDLNISSSESEVKTAKKVRDMLDKIHGNKTTDWQFYYIWDASNFIGQAITELLINIGIGTLVAIGVLFIVFRNVRTILVIAISIPICIMTTLLVLKLFNYSINIMTLMAIGIGTGMIVDACIVVLENIFRKIQMGIEKKEAVLSGTREVMGPVISSVLTTIAVFLPIGYLEGFVGQLTKQLALTVTTALVSSLVVSLTVIPLLSYYLSTKQKESALGSKLTDGYIRILEFCLRSKWIILTGFTVLLVVFSYALVVHVPKNYVPNVSERALYVRFEVDEKTNFSTTKTLLSETAEKIENLQDVQNVFYWADEGRSHRGNFYIHYEPVEEMSMTEEEVNQQIEKAINETIPYSFLTISSGQTDTSGRLQIAVRSSTMADIITEVPLIRDNFMLIQGVTGVESSIAKESVEWSIDFSQQQLDHFGLTRNSVEQYVRTVLNGVKDIKLKVAGKEKTADIVFPKVYRESSDALFQLPIQDRANLTLESVATLSNSPAEANRTRKNGNYEIEMTIYYEKEQRYEIERQVDLFLANYQSQDVYLSYTGTQQEQDEAFINLILAAVVAFALVFFILTVQFNRLRQPFVIMASLPFTLIGVAVGFLITGRVFDIVAMIGIVMLVGIVVNNAIVLIDVINNRRAEGYTVHNAIIDGARTRLRPILTTTLTTVGGLIAMFIGGTNTSDFQTPLATAVIFGLLFSTLVSLLVLPIIYSLFESVAGFFSRRSNKNTEQKQLTEETIHS